MGNAFSDTVTETTLDATLPNRQDCNLVVTNCR